MKEFTYQDIEDYYDQTEVHYRTWWKLEKSLGLHYGVWDEKTKTTADAIINLNRVLMELGELKENDRVLDAGCGVGGSSFYLAENINCRTSGVTLSQKQVDSASQKAKEKGLEKQCDFLKCSYTETPFDASSFDAAWAIESLGSAQNKGEFFQEMGRLLKPGGKILIADTLKPKSFDISNNKYMKMMLNGWAISDILSIQEIKDLASEYGFRLRAEHDASPQIKKSVDQIYWAYLIGRFSSRIYNFIYKKSVSRFAKIHYKTGLAQKKTFEKGEWKYMLLVFEKEEKK
ncbi:MAG: methyltransferase domain-containing protein [Vicingaceae bacterium]